MSALTANLTERQAAYVDAVIAGHPPLAAISLAGYSAPSAALYSLKNNAQVQAAIAAGLRRFLYTEAAPAALKLMYDFMVDPTREDKLRLACAKSLADRAGYIPPKAKEDKALGDKSFIDMTADELRETSQRIAKELSERAVVVLDNVPSNEEGIDIFG